MSRNSEFLIVFGLATLVLASSAVEAELSPGAIAETGWEWSNPHPQGNHLAAAVVHDGVSVAVGSNGTIIASTDNVIWKVVNGSTEYDLVDVIWANGLFVAVGGQYGFEFSSESGVVLTSADGYNWVEQHAVDYFLARSVVWDGARFVAVGNGARVLFSSDGIHWTDEAVELADWEIVDLVWDGARYLAVGNAYFGYGSIFMSEDAVTWQELPFECECSLRAIAWGNNRYVAVGYAGGGAVFVSSDAQNWDSQSIENTSTLNDVLYGVEGFTVVGDNGILIRSHDGNTWSTPEAIADGTIYSVTDDDGTFLTVGNRGQTALSRDGGAWEVTSSDSLNVYRNIQIFEMAVGGDVVVGVGEYSLIIRSADGAHWSTNPSWKIGFYLSVNRIGSDFWAVADFGIARSPDGLDWELMLYDPDLRLSDISWSGETFAAVGEIATPEGLVSLVTTSPDGIVWTHQPMDAGGKILAVRWTGSRFVAVGNNGVHLTSPDGLTWSQHPRDESIRLKDMEWSGDRLVAVGGRQGVGGVIRYSEDGLVWEDGLSPEVDVGGVDDVSWTGSQFVAAGNGLGNRVFTSSDGINWNFESVGIGIAPRAVCGNEHSLHLAALGGKIIRKVLRRETPPPRRPSRRVAPSSNKGLAVEPSVVRRNRRPLIIRPGQTIQTNFVLDADLRILEPGSVADDIAAGR